MPGLQDPPHLVAIARASPPHERASPTVQSLGAQTRQCLYEAAEDAGQGRPRSGWAHAGHMGLETVRGRRAATIPGRFIIETSFGEEFVGWIVRSLRGPVAVSLVTRMASRSVVCGRMMLLGRVQEKSKRLFAGWHLRT